ncbi:hypothetical protein SSX86_021712 [Deinandra increscens subsp. villosa]|uniref:Late embryogenesis abundant protein LEA-2 subgroup domain-containing protein n=1 Tax=Deinandra increscens subsp. villosa TaxID=3103831 RepID=A0AAP0CTK2_9ASTR
MTAEHHGPGHVKSCCRIFFAFIVFICILITLPLFITGLVFLAAYLFPDYPYPTFTLQDVKLYTFNVSSTTNSTLTSTLQITLSCRNGHEDDYNYYDGYSFQLDKFYVYATYRNQQITRPTLMVPTMHISNPDAVVWSSYLNGTEVSFNPDLAAYLEQDLLAGEMLISVEGSGWMRSKYGVYWVRSRLKVDCMAYVTFKNNNNVDNVIGNLVVKHPFEDRNCRVDVVKRKAYTN